MERKRKSWRRTQWAAWRSSPGLCLCLTPSGLSAATLKHPETIASSGARQMLTEMLTRGTNSLEGWLTTNSRVVWPLLALCVHGWEVSRGRERSGCSEERERQEDGALQSF